ncbi:MAG TPA: SUMF1/EgtB/PvdO family nonheme iron enzyme [Pyrinomonadaceae bacterium]
MKECPACKRCFADEINHCPQDGDATIPTLSGETTLDGRYLLERRLGQGGMGVVFQARHIFLKTAHAIKIIIPEMVGNDPMLATRFRQEALAAAAIRHQNIIAVTDFGMVRGTMPFLVMEFVKGRSLQEILGAEGPMKPERAWELISPIAAGVGAAHRQNIVHRDLKPLNIMLQENVPAAEGLKILDFGLAKIKSGELLGSFVQAQTSGLMGSPFYMAPEQWSDEEPDARADIYSLGIILYQMLAGEVPFKGSSIPSIMKKHLTLPPPTFQSMGVTVPPQIEAVVRHALEKEVADRIDSIEAFLKELRGATTASPGTVTQGRQTGSLDPNKTMASQTAPVDSNTKAPGFSATSVQTPVSGDTDFGASFESMPGTINLDGEVSQQVSEKAAALRREREAHEAREAEALKKREEEATRKRKADDDRQQEERAAKEREQQEKLEKMALQAKELEDRLERLSVSMSPASLVDPEVTHIQKGQTTSPGGFVPTPAAPVGSNTGQSKGPVMLIVVAAIVVLGLGGVGITAFVLLRPKQTTQVVSKSPVDEPTPSKADLVQIDGGTFDMGRNGGPPQERPAHSIQVPTFYMDKTEVTNAEYADFVRDTNHPAPGYWSGQKPPFGQEQWPVVNVSQEDAIGFAAWRSKRDSTNYRLPTEDEWEYAARNGSQDDLYPWGKDWQDGNAVVKEATPAPVGSHAKGANKWGVADLIGNVWEWTSSKVSSYPGNPIKIPTETRDLVTIRGACYVSDPNKGDAPVTSAMREFIPANTKTPLLGFRLVRSGH